jgi:C-terminal processing protease CtpA/Prc
MFSGMTVDNMIIGGPAFNSKLLERGDVICQIDRIPVVMDELQQSLLGSDVPSSTVVLTVRKKTGRIIDVPLKRMAISVISDRCNMFELFAACKVPISYSLHFFCGLCHCLTLVFSLSPTSFPPPVCFCL